MWWQEVPAEEGAPKEVEKPKEGAEGAKAVSYDALGTHSERSLQLSTVSTSGQQTRARVLAEGITDSELRDRGDRDGPVLLRYLRQVPVLPGPWGTCGEFLVVPHFYISTERLVSQVTPKFVNSLVELITSSIDNVSSPDVHPSQRAPPGLLEAVQTPEMITRHFRNTLHYIQAKKHAADNGGAADERWTEVDVVGALLKMGIAR